VIVMMIMMMMTVAIPTRPDVALPSSGFFAICRGRSGESAAEAEAGATTEELKNSGDSARVSATIS
jgi:hypothetical protein